MQADCHPLEFLTKPVVGRSSVREFGRPQRSCWKRSGEPAIVTSCNMCFQSGRDKKILRLCRAAANSFSRGGEREIFFVTTGQYLERYIFNVIGFLAGFGFTNCQKCGIIEEGVGEKQNQECRM